MTVAHRPWPLPEGPSAWRQSWRELLFAHWPIEVADLRRLVPPTLDIDTFESRAWIGVVPFRMTGVRPRFAPALPWLSAFAELNLRTYVSYRGERPGVFFFSLDAANPVAVRIARRMFHLPYFDARMSCRRAGDAVEYSSRRTHRGAPPGEFVGRYRPVGEVFRAGAGSLDHWLTERYCLYAAAGERVWRAEIHHAPWPLQPAEVEIDACSLTDSWELELPARPPLAHYAERLDVVVWPLRRL